MDKGIIKGKLPIEHLRMAAWIMLKSAPTMRIYMSLDYYIEMHYIFSITNNPTFGPMHKIKFHLN